MDRTTRGIIMALVLVLGVTLLAIIASFALPYTVTVHASLTSLQGSATISTAGETPRPLTLAPSERHTLRLGQTLRLDPASTAALTFDLLAGRAIFSGPGALSILRSERKATTPGHLRRTGHYTLEIQQEGGLARYFFDRTSVPWDQVAIIVWTNDPHHPALRPSAPCWQVDLTGPSALVQSFPCP